MPKIIAPKPTLGAKSRAHRQLTDTMSVSPWKGASVSHFGVAQDLKMAEMAVRRSKEGPGWVLRRS